MKIVWDLDGVIRDLNGYLIHLHGGKYPTEWKWTYGNGKSIYDTINDDLSILTKCPATAYISVLKKHFTHPEFWTSQATKWKEPTTEWLSIHFGEHFDVRFLKCAEKEDRLKQCEDTLLIEDSPNFVDYERIVLIDRPYNQEVKNVVRIFGTKHLDNVLELTKGAVN